MNVNFIMKMYTSWIEHYCAVLNHNPDADLSKNQFFMYSLLQISIMK